MFLPISYTGAVTAITTTDFFALFPYFYLVKRAHTFSRITCSASTGTGPLHASSFPICLHSRTGREMLTFVRSMMVWLSEACK